MGKIVKGVVIRGYRIVTDGRRDVNGNTFFNIKCDNCKDITDDVTLKDLMVMDKCLCGGKKPSILSKIKKLFK